jgi:hypothetical protein
MHDCVKRGGASGGDPEARTAGVDACSRMGAGAKLLGDGGGDDEARECIKYFESCGKCGAASRSRVCHCRALKL